MKKLNNYLAALCLSASAYAGIVIYTDSSNPVNSTSLDVLVVYLDALERLQMGIFVAPS